MVICSISVRDRTGVWTQAVWPQTPFSHLTLLCDFSVQGRGLGWSFLVKVVSKETSLTRVKVWTLEAATGGWEVGGTGWWRGWKARGLDAEIKRKGRINPNMLHPLKNNSILLTILVPKKASRVSVWMNGHYVNMRIWQNKTSTWSSVHRLGHRWAGPVKHILIHSCLPDVCLEDKQGWKYEFEISYIFKSWNHDMWSSLKKSCWRRMKRNTDGRGNLGNSVLWKSADLHNVRSSRSATLKGW